MTKEIYDGKVSGREVGRPPLTFENSVKDTGGKSRKKHEIKKIIIYQGTKLKLCGGFGRESRSTRSCINKSLSLMAEQHVRSVK